MGSTKVDESTYLAKVHETSFSLARRSCRFLGEIYCLKCFSTMILALRKNNLGKLLYNKTFSAAKCEDCRSMKVIYSHMTTNISRPFCDRVYLFQYDEVREPIGSKKRTVRYQHCIYFWL